MADFSSVGVASAPVSLVKGFCPKVVIETGSKLIYFKNYPTNNKEINSFLTIEAIQAFHDANVTMTVPYVIANLVKNKTIRFVVLVDKTNNIQGMTAFVSNDQGHVVICVAVAESLRSNNYGK